MVKKQKKNYLKKNLYPNTLLKLENFTIQILKAPENIPPPFFNFRYLSYHI